MEADEKKVEKVDDLDGKETKLKKDNIATNLKNAVFQEATWAAVAAIGGAIIVIWNIIKYLCTFCSSLFMYSLTKVPFYLLMKSQNQPFTDANLLITTISFMVMIISYTEYNPILFISDKSIFIDVLWFGVVFSCPFFLFPIGLIIKNAVLGDFEKVYQLFYIFFKVIIYIYPVCMISVFPILGKKYILSKNDEKSMSNIMTKSRKERIIIWKQDHLFPEEYDEFYKEEYFKKYKDFSSSFPRGILFLPLIMLLLSTIPMNYLFDQNNRLIVADLGEQYIVQEAIFDQDNEEIYIDNSCYYVVSSSDEKIRIVNDNIHPINK